MPCTKDQTRAQKTNNTVPRYAWTGLLVRQFLKQPAVVDQTMHCDPDYVSTSTSGVVVLTATE
jgi:hypothetical protein